MKKLQPQFLYNILPVFVLACLIYLGVLVYRATEADPVLEETAPVIQITTEACILEEPEPCPNCSVDFRWCIERLKKCQTKSTVYMCKSGPGQPFRWCGQD